MTPAFWNYYPEYEVGDSPDTEISMGAFTGIRIPVMVTGK